MKHVRDKIEYRLINILLKCVRAVINIMKHLEVVLHEIHIIETGEILKLSKNGDVLVSFANESCVINGRRVICGRVQVVG